MAKTRTLEAVHAHYSLKNEEYIEIIETVANNTVLVCCNSISENSNKYFNKKYINGNNRLCKITKILEKINV